MKHLLWVALGGALGALGRFGLGKAFRQWNPHESFSVGTLAANLAGCFLMGLLVVVIAQSEELHREALTAFFLTGFLGSLTTFSTFILEFFKLAGHGNSKLVVSHLVAHLAIGVLGLWAGYSAAHQFVESS